MINGPGNVWLEGHGRLTQIDAPALDAAALDRAAIHIARPLGLDPATTPILDARLDDGSRVAICVPAGEPACGDHRPALRHACLFSDTACRTRRAPRTHPPCGRADLARAPQYPGERRHRQRQDDATQCPHRTHPRRRADRGHRGTRSSCGSTRRTVSGSRRAGSKREL